MSKSPVFDIMPIDWQAIAAVATFAAVAVAVLLPILRDRRRLKVSAMIGRLIVNADGSKGYFISSKIGTPDGNFTPSVFIRLVNMGPRTIIVQQWACRYTRRAAKNHGKKYVTLLPESDNLPRQLSYGDHAMLWHTEVLDFIQDVRWMAVSDTLGRSWRVPCRYIRRLKKSRKQDQL